VHGIDDRQATHPESDALSKEESVTVRAAIDDGFAHHPEDGA
jgi:hypothetical protein